MAFKKIGLPLFISLFLFACQSDDNGAPTPIDNPDPDPNAIDIILSDEVSLNPTGYAPLSASIALALKEPVSVRMRVVGQNGNDSDIVQDFSDMGTNLTIPIHGLYADFDNTVELTFFDDSGNNLGVERYTIKTTPLISEMPLISIQEAKREQMADGFTLVSYFGHNGAVFPQRPFMFDSFGSIRWYLDFSRHPVLNTLFYDNGVERLANGNFYFGSGGGAFGGGGDNTIYEIDLFGSILNSWEMPGYGFHHEVSEKPNGNFLVTVSKLGAPTIEDYIIEIDRSSKEIIREWDLNESLQNTRMTLIEDMVDWIHVNAITYDATDDTIIISGRTQGLIKLTNANEVVWIMGPQKDWGMAGNGMDLNSFLLNPLDNQGQPISDQAVLDGDENHPDFEWNWYQHAPLVMPNGNIMLFDNGDNRNFIGNTYSRAVEYKIDTQNKTIQQVWEYGKSRSSGLYSRIVSDVDYLESVDHVLVSPGAISAGGQISGKSVEVDYMTGAVIFEATIIPPLAFFDVIALHRTERLSLYPEQ
ncbi:MAG: aryl-sulfate sulfotransferase [Bacteroidota bacterium]